MRGLTGQAGSARQVGILMLCAVLLAGCKRRAHAEDAPKEAPAELLSVFQVADPRAAVQMTRGFHALEGNSWRWTASRFRVVLAAPPAAAEKGARLELKFSIPDVIFDRLGAITLSASFDGERLEPESYTQPGEHTYTRPIAPRAFGGGAVSVEFATDKSLPPTSDDTRELALIVTALGLQPQ
jgi:hypothetical protein